MMRFTSRPATLPASFVAWRWSSLKYAGTVITALSTVSPRYASASAFSFWRIIALTSGGEYSPSPAFTRASPFGPRATVKGTIVSSSLTSASLRPMKRLTENTVFSGFVTACRLATVPTRRSPLPVKATTEGVVRAPSAFSTTVGSPPSSTAMHELVVPRSMPIVLPIRFPPAGSLAQKSESKDGRFVRDRPPSSAGRRQPAPSQGLRKRGCRQWRHDHTPALAHSSRRRPDRHGVRHHRRRCGVEAPQEAEVRSHLRGQLGRPLVRPHERRRAAPQLPDRHLVRRRVELRRLDQEEAEGH